MALFTDPAMHAANGPDTWQVVRSVAGGRARWALTTKGGEVLDTFDTRGKAQQATVSGFYVDLYAKEGRWYAGEPVAGWKPYVQPTES